MPSSTLRRLRRGVIVTGVVSAIICVFVGLAGYFNRDPYELYPAKGRALPIAAVNFSGDMGVRFLLGASTMRGLTEHGVTTMAVVTPTLFRHRRTRAEIDAIVTDGIRTALERTGAQRIVVIGQSYGADIVQTGLAHLPADLRARVAAIILILPGETVFFRADPSSIEYHGTPDAYGIETARTLTWAPLTCIYGVEEGDSLCPHLRISGARLIGMPGGHNVRHDEAGLLRHVLHAIAQVMPAHARGRLTS
ncbi:AcvB/VirJ family lysyl-phosphatidylglycerol hydrolase [Sphingomonas sp. Mn802worker]|uniref:AcvB/VirJ family lysyl-phosphatidylglycerol hydrolase n=1 Tax=Sphingomonas sp. Mn802worker TaxID=629773 RepID=UPI00036C1F61|nr:AcvB/VirJ family lysyl-phosphatidylglycerol hydrolase [Sphingomonas sp. Mn802worker]